MKIIPYSISGLFLVSFLAASSAFAQEETQWRSPGNRGYVEPVQYGRTIPPSRSQPMEEGPFVVPGSREAEQPVGAATPETSSVTPPGENPAYPNIPPAPVDAPNDTTVTTPGGKPGDYVPGGSDSTLPYNPNSVYNGGASGGVVNGVDAPSSFIYGDTPLQGGPGLTPQFETGGDVYDIGINTIPVDSAYSMTGSNLTTGFVSAPSMNSTQTMVGSDAKKGFVRKANISALWAPGMGSGNEKLPMYQFNAGITLGAPFFGNSGLGISPDLQMFRFDWPNDFGLENNMYTASLGIAWVKEFGKYKLTLGASPGWSSDMKATEDAFQMPLYATVFWNCNSRINVTLGVIYLDREDVPFLPIAGLVWKPNDDVIFDLMFPRPKISHRVRWWGSQAGDRVTDWVYIGGEFAGGSWAVETDRNGRKFQGKLEYFDYRAMIGFERKIKDSVTFSLEAGYLFGRQFTIPDISGKYEPEASPFIRARIYY